MGQKLLPIKYSLVISILYKGFWTPGTSTFLTVICQAGSDEI